MGRPAKPIGTEKGVRRKAEKQTRKAIQDQLQGEADKLAPPSYFTATQKKIYKDIVKHYQALDFIANMDISILETTCIAIDKLRIINTALNEDENAMLDKNLMCTREKFMKDFIIGVNHFGLSPMARAKLGVLASQKKEAEKDPLLKALGE